MANGTTKKTLTDIDVKHKAVKLVISHLKKKLTKDYIGSDHVNAWISEAEQLLEKSEFNMSEHFQMRRSLNELIEGILDEEIRFKLRDSWYSYGKALDKKVKIK